MSNRLVAARIPDRVRSERLLVPADPIGRAVPASSNPELQLLFAVWYEFIEPKAKGNLNCPYCLNNIVTNFKAMLPDLLELEHEYQLLLRL